VPEFWVSVVPISSGLSSPEREFTLLLTGRVIFRTPAVVVKYVFGRFFLMCPLIITHVSSKARQIMESVIGIIYVFNIPSR
jgi:hypothetical protein